MPELVGGVDFTTLDFLGLILGATRSVDDMSACLGLIGALADNFFALPRGSLGPGGGRTFSARCRCNGDSGPSFRRKQGRIFGEVGFWGLVGNRSSDGLSRLIG